MGDSCTSAPDSAAQLTQIAGDVGQLSRIIEVQGGQLAWLVGAGASAMSNIPTASALILRFKHELYCSLNGLDVQDVDPSDKRVRKLIEDYFNGRNGLPPIGDPDEYSIAFETVYPSADARADFIAALCRGRRPNYGHYVLAALMAVERLGVAFTTNFDDLIESGAQSLFDSAAIDPRPTVVVAGLGEPDLASRALHKSTWPLIAKLHGDFRSVRLKNTVAELTQQDEEMRRVFRSACNRFGLVIVGYSGRDQSVMTVLAQALDDAGSFPAGINWCYRLTEPPADTVVEFLTAAAATGRTVMAVPVDNFIEFAGTIERAVRFPANVRTDLAQRRPPAIVTPAPFPTGHTRSYPILRLNAVPVMMPSQVQRLSENAPSDLAAINEAVRRARIRALVARRSGGQLVAVGHDAQLAEVLRPLGISLTEQLEELNWGAATVDPADLGLALDAITIGLGRTDGLRHVLSRRAHQVRVADSKLSSLERLRSACGSLMGTVPRTSLAWAEAVQLTIERRNAIWWLLVGPEIWVSPASGPVTDENRDDWRADRAAAAEFVRNRRATRYNREANAILDAWVRLLCNGRGPREVRTWNLVPGDGIDPAFTIGGLTAFSHPLTGSEPITRSPL
jgi:NAD-dependent SIR2 family protein deacetylase